MNQSKLRSSCVHEKHIGDIKTLFDFSSQDNQCKVSRPKTVNNSIINNPMSSIMIQSFYQVSSIRSESIDEKQTLMKIKNEIIKEYPKMFEKIADMTIQEICSDRFKKELYQKCKEMKRLIPAFDLKQHKELLVDVLKIIDMEIREHRDSQADGPQSLFDISQISDLSNNNSHQSFFGVNSDKFSDKMLCLIRDLNNQGLLVKKQDNQNVQLIEQHQEEIMNQVDQAMGSNLFPAKIYTADQVNQIKKTCNKLYQEEKLKQQQIKQNKVVTLLKPLRFCFVFGAPVISFTVDFLIIHKLKRQGRLNETAMRNAIIAKFGKNLAAGVTSIGVGIAAGIVFSFFLPIVGTCIGGILAGIAAGTLTDILIEKHIKEYIQSEIKPETYSKQYKQALLKIGFKKKDISKNNICSIKDDWIQKMFEKNFRKFDPDEENEKIKKKNEAEIIKLVVAHEIIKIHREEIQKQLQSRSNDKDNSIEILDDSQESMMLSSFEMNDQYLASDIINMSG